MLDRQRNKSAGAKPFHPSACVIAGFLMKLAKHLALIACLMIVGGSTGRFAGGELGIFLTVLTAAFLDSIGRVLQRRLQPPAHLPRFDP
ncbi:MAG TPA: hypothetical protein VGB09_11965 [Candidatus Binatia bacterium]